MTGGLEAGEKKSTGTGGGFGMFALLARAFPICVAWSSAGLFALSFYLLPVYSHGYSVREEVPAACTEAAGLILAFLAIRRLRRWPQTLAGLLLLLNGVLFLSSLWHLRVNSN